MKTHLPERNGRPVEMTNKLSSVLRVIKENTIIQLVIAFLFLLGITWPFLVVKNQSNNRFVFYFLFGLWFLMILIHFILDLFNSGNNDK